MFANVGWGEIALLMFVGLFVLGPERLPGAAAWLGRTVRQLREYGTGARDQLKDQLGPEFDDLRKPLADLQQLRGMSPRAAITKHLFDGEPASMFGDTAAAGTVDPASANPISMTKAKTFDPVNAPVPLAKGERPPFDPDAT
ncbi:MAG: Sec-independent protein translocase protein TatB [Mycobacteriaceae bacterium]